MGKISLLKQLCVTSDLQGLADTEVSRFDRPNIVIRLGKRASSNTQTFTIYRLVVREELVVCKNKKNVKQQFAQRKTPSHVSLPPKSKWHVGQRRINETGKCITENTAFSMVLRAGVRVRLCRVAVCIEFAFDRLGVMTTQAS